MSASAYRHNLQYHNPERLSEEWNDGNQFIRKSEHEESSEHENRYQAGFVVDRTTTDKIFIYGKSFKNTIISRSQSGMRQYGPDRQSFRHFGPFQVKYNKKIYCFQAFQQYFQVFFHSTEKNNIICKRMA